MAVTDYTQLETWQKAMDLADAVCKITRVYPKEEVRLAERFGYIDADRSAGIIEQSWTVGRLINGLIRAVAPPAEPS